jgi:hypothetical protein
MCGRQSHPSATIFETINEEIGFARRGKRRDSMPDVDLPKAEHALSVLRRARLSRNETAATMIAELVYEMSYKGFHATPEIEEAREAAWVEISALSASLRADLYARPAMWNAALKATERWKELLS